MFVIIAICQDATFCHLFVNFFQTFDNFLPNSPSSQNLCQLSTCPFLSSHLNIWPNPWWIFGRLTIFVEICLLSIFPSLSPHLRFYQIMGGFFLNSPFSQICHFCENRQLPIWLFCCLIVSNLAKFVIWCHFSKLTIIDMPLLSPCFNFCQTFKQIFSKFVIFVKSPFVKMPLFVISFEYFAKPLMNFWHNRHFCQNLLFSAKFAIFLL